jgi:Fe-S oxidoreductase
MLPGRADARQLREQTFTLAEFLEQNASACEFPQLRQKAIVQAHCHHKAIMRFDQERSVMEKVGLDYRVLESGCCGMAGAFGYEKDKYEVSVACGERVLLPEVRQVPEDTIIVADGFSCREQIEQQTGRSTLHLAEVLKLAINARLDQREA